MELLDEKRVLDAEKAKLYGGTQSSEEHAIRVDSLSLLKRTRTQAAEVALVMLVSCLPVP